MGRRRTIEPARIIQSALFVLSTRGVEAVTIAQIAQQAGISEASIYKFFASKEELLQACFAEGRDPQEFWGALVARAGSLPVEALLSEAAVFTIHHCERQLPTLLLRVLRPETAFCSGPMRTAELQARYFAREMELGRIRLNDPQYLAFAFVGPLFYRVFAARALQAHLADSDDEFAHCWARDFARGL